MEVLDFGLDVADAVGVDVAEGDEADHDVLLIEHGKVADALGLHDGGDIFDGRVGVADGDVAGHDLFDEGAFGVAAFGDDTRKDVAFGEDADDMAALLDNQGANAVAIHELGGVNDGGEGIDGIHVTAFFHEDVGNDGHSAPLFENAKAKTQNSKHRPEDMTGALYTWGRVKCNIVKKLTGEWRESALGAAGGEVFAEVFFEGGETGSGPSGFDLVGDGFVGGADLGEPLFVGAAGGGVKVFVVGVDAEDGLAVGAGLDHDFHVGVGGLAEANREADAAGEGAGGAAGLFEEVGGDFSHGGQGADAGDAVERGLGNGRAGVGEPEIDVDSLLQDGRLHGSFTSPSSP